MRYFLHQDDMDSDDEVDYMSDSFLQSISGKDDIRPGLIKSHSQKYDDKRAQKKIVTDRKNCFNNPSIKEKEKESREDGLSRPINDSNIGFKMLQKLGFKPGSGLGKSGEGRLDPISVKVKSDRHGLGRQSALEEIIRLKQKNRAEAREKLLNVEEYRSRKAQELAEKKAQSELLKCQRVCWELDFKESIQEPVDDWFWPKQKLPKSYLVEEEQEEENSSTKNAEENYSDEEENYAQGIGDEEEEVELSVQEMLEILTSYIRKNHLYCVWCGHSFEDEKDLQQECPGPLKEDH